MLGIVARMDGKLSAVRNALPHVINTPELRFDCDDRRKFQVIEEVAARLRAEGAKVAETDGVRVLTDDGWWLLRASNTQAVLVARAEATSEEGLERLKRDSCATWRRWACRRRTSRAATRGIDPSVQWPAPPPPGIARARKKAPPTASTSATPTRKKVSP